MSFSSDTESDDHATGGGVVGVDFSTATVVRTYVEDDLAKAKGLNERMHEIGEAHFGTAGPEMVARGWSVLPQDRNDGKRGSAKIGGFALNWRPYQTRRPTEKEIKDWALQQPGANAAIILGPASGHAFAIDVDIDDRVAAWRVRELAAKHLGHTPFQRVGREPRIVLFYRHDPAEKLRKIQWKYKIGAVELLGDASLVTAYGRHHATGDYFKWISSARPSMHGPEHAPLVSKEAIEAFYAAVDAEFEPLPGQRDGKEAREFLERPIVVGNVVVPVGADRVAGVQYIDGKAVDGRETLLNWIAVRLATHNPHGAEDALLGVLLREFSLHALIDGKWETSLLEMARERLRSALVAVAEGRLTAKRIYRAEDGSVYAPARIEPTIEGVDEDIRALAPAAKRQPLDVLAMTKPDAEKAKARALIEDRSEITEATTTSVKESIRKWLIETLYDHEGEDVILDAPTGAGKTSSLLSVYGEVVAERGSPKHPLGVLMKNYNNIEEAREKTPRNLKSMVFQGKIRAGCLFAEHLKRLQDAGIGGSSMCEGRDEVTGEKTFCEFYHSCPAQQQKHEIAGKDIVFIPHAFATKNIPKELKKLSALVVDESVSGEFLDVQIFASAVLNIARPDPFVTKKEAKKARLAGERMPTPEDYSMGREEYCRVVLEAFRKGEDPAKALLRHPKGEFLVAAERRVLSHADDSHRRIQPNMTIAAINEQCDRPRLTGIWQEKRMSAVIEERYELLKLDRVTDRLTAATGIKISSPRNAKGDADARLQLLRPDDESEFIRVSWRAKTKFPSVPMMLMDASAAPEVSGKVFGREFRVIEVDAPLHLRTVGIIDQVYSNASLLPEKWREDDTRRERAARNKYSVRTAISSIAGIYGYGRVLVGANKEVRKSLQKDWASPGNVDWIHNGAMRGLDFAKHHDAAVYVGRMELSTRVLDGLVSALTYDDEHPEMPVDVLGTGKDADGKPLPINMADRTYPLRDGRDVTVRIPQYSGKWASLVQKQHREEECRQFIGRLRPVYREGEAPLAIIVSSVIPEGVILDDVMTLDDLRIFYREWEAVRRSGIVDPRMSAFGCADVVDVLKMNRFVRWASSGRPAKGVMQVEYRLEGEEKTRSVRAPMYSSAEDVRRALAVIHEPKKTYEETLEEAQGLRPPKVAPAISIVATGEEMSIAKPKKPDAIDEELGTREQRANAEMDRRMKAMGNALEEYSKYRWEIDSRRWPLKVGSAETVKQDTKATNLVDIDVRALYEEP